MLALMISSSAEDSELCLTCYGEWEEVTLKSDVLLENVRSLVKEMKVHIFAQYSVKMIIVIIVIRPNMLNYTSSDMKVIALMDWTVPPAAKHNTSGLNAVPPVLFKKHVVIFLCRRLP